MNKYLFIWKSGHIVHIIAPDKDIATGMIPTYLYEEIPVRFWEPCIAWHPAGSEDYRNPNLYGVWGEWHVRR